MKLIRLAIISLSLMGFGAVSANSFTERSFNQDHMITTNYNQVIILSTYNDEDHITSYSDYGNFQWDIRLSTKVISMKIKEGYLYIFSRSRYTDKTYLTCADASTGIVIWERP